jgi:hypothetical protein
MVKPKKIWIAWDVANGDTHPDTWRRSWDRGKRALRLTTYLWAFTSQRRALAFCAEHANNPGLSDLAGPVQLSAHTLKRFYRQVTTTKDYRGATYHHRKDRF